MFLMINRLPSNLYSHYTMYIVIKHCNSCTYNCGVFRILTVGGKHELGDLQFIHNKRIKDMQDIIHLI